MDHETPADGLPHPRILVLGAAGQLGRAAAQAFRTAGWSVASLVRGSAGSAIAPGTELIEVDARDTAAVIEAARGADVVLNALNVPFTQWTSVRDAARGDRHRGGPRERRDAGVSRQPLCLWRQNSGDRRRDDPDRSDLAQGRNPRRHRGAPARRGRRGHAGDRPAQRRLLRRADPAPISTACSSATSLRAGSPIRGRSTSCTNGPTCPTSPRRCGVSSTPAPRSRRSRNSDFPAMP